MEFEKQILSMLIDSYEKRNPESGTGRKVSVDISKKYPQYREVLSDTQEKLESAILHLHSWGFIDFRKNIQGYYTKVFLTESSLLEIYRFLQRTPRSALLMQQKELLSKTADRTNGLTRRFCREMLERIGQGKDILFGLSKNIGVLEDVLLALEHIEKLTQETYIRNFSEMVFHDSKRLQNILSPITKILLDYGDIACQKENVLAQYNLVNNPGYIYIKGDWNIVCQGRCISTDAFRGGIAISSTSLDAIERITVRNQIVISVENLTTYHDTSESEGAILYLGGFHNTVRTNFLKKLYSMEPGATYYHKGDLDPYGFLILENLKQKTGIPFQSLDMDLDTLKRCYRSGHFRPLDEADRKALDSPVLAEYKPILQYMAEYNCKIEQECFEAM